MLDSDLIPTPLGAARGPRHVEIRAPAPPSRWRGLVLLKTTTTFGGWLLWRQLRRQRVPPEEAGAALRAIFESLGGLWIKLGQLLAMRRDLLPHAFCSEIGRLQDRAIGFSGAIARRIVEEDLGAPADVLFDDFEDAPFAAASIGQLHRATLNGAVLAVKVQRPYIGAVIERDLRYATRLFLTLDWLGVRRNFHWPDLVYELTKAMREELDYHLEATSMARMRRRLRRHGIYVPKLHRGLSSGRVLTMEFVSGVLMSDFVATRDADPEAVARWLKDNEIDPELAGRRLHLSLIRQILEDNLFHGDLHPGNILLLRRSRVALIDFGSVGSLEAHFLRLYVMLNKAMAEGEYEKVADIMALIAPAPDPSIDWDRIRRGVAGALRQAEIRAWAPNLSYHERSMNSAMVGVARTLAGSRIPVGWTFMRVDRAHVTLDASLMYLVPDMNYVALGKRYFRKAFRRGFSAKNLRRLADRFRRARALPTASFLSERLHLEQEVMEPGVTVFRQSRRHLEEVVAFACGYLARLCLASSILVAAFFSARDRTPMGAAAGVLLVAVGVALSVLERHAREQRRDPGTKEPEEVEEAVS